MIGRIPETPEDYQEIADEVSAALAEQEGHMSERMPSAWSEFGDGHDYSRTGKHDPNNCRGCMREATQTALRALLEQWTIRCAELHGKQRAHSGLDAGVLDVRADEREECINELRAVAARLSPEEPR